MKRVTAFLRRAVVPRSWTGLILRLVVLVVLVLVIAGPLAWNASVDHARKSASETIAQASAAIEDARPAANENTWEADQLESAQTALVEANASYDSGSFFNRGSYERAKSHAKDSLALSKSVTKRVEDRLAAAEAFAEQPGNYRQAIKAFFSFYKRYPRTADAQVALDEAESALFSMPDNERTIKKLAAIANFETHYPLKQLPSRTTSEARNYLLEIARAQYDELKMLTRSTHSWAHTMLGKGKADPIWISLSSSGTRDVSTALKLIRSLRQPPAMRRLLSLLKTSDGYGKQITVTYAHPSSETSTSRLYSTYQISSIDSLTDQIMSRLSQEKKLIAKL